MTAEEGADTVVAHQTAHQAGPDVDVVVAGGGMAGLTAAATAASHGATVLLAEAGEKPGGAAWWSNGLFWTARDLQTYRRHIPDGNPVIAERIIAGMDDALEQIRALGVPISAHRTDPVMAIGAGHAIDIRALIQEQEARLRRHGGRIVTGARVTGAALREGAVDVRISSGGSEQRVRSWALVLATGGHPSSWPASSDLADQPVPGVARRCLLHSRGDGLRAGRELGADTAGPPEGVYGHLVPAPLAEDWTPASFVRLSQYYSDAAVALDLRGRRFADETLGDEVLNQALLDHTETARASGDADAGTTTPPLAVLLFDDRVRRSRATEESYPGLGPLDRFAAAVDAGGANLTAEDVPGLVYGLAALGVDTGTARTTVERYREAIASRSGIADGVPVTAEADPLTEAPFHALLVQPSVTMTFHGVRTDERFRVLDRGGRPVPGVFAAGADAGGLQGRRYAGGLAPSFIGGRTAGLEAARLAASAQGTRR
ncbi:FAD-dependent oxidoreductase [Sediminivirga luteola]|uniref:FAD-dependent oxidoreductase 2 FAD-binding domain-containing protein n=1 Tax=Sediminivirga luteola TaxID=1774748 RepID=A0A8J2TX09_9MICO|nr:FAD-dependent oxidoreductase [Sediminivirga luteola]GGA10118.1 hypothetical protein GCM10011333_11050 [Sediminivirga luteola]